MSELGVVVELTRKRVIKSLQERDNCALATSTGSDQSQSLSWLHMDVQTLKDFDIGTGRVVEMEVTSLYLTTHLILRRIIIESC